MEKQLVTRDNVNSVKDFEACISYGKGVQGGYTLSITMFDGYAISVVAARDMKKKDAVAMGKPLLKQLAVNYLIEKNLY